jgi:hypothetical protein
VLLSGECEVLTGEASAREDKSPPMEAGPLARVLHFHGDRDETLTGHADLIRDHDAKKKKEEANDLFLKT